MRCPEVHCRCDCCDLPLRTSGDPAHPGYVVVEQFRTAAGFQQSCPGLVGLGFTHRCCGRALHSVAPEEHSSFGLIVRRAWLGLATERYEAGRLDGLVAGRAWVGFLAVSPTATARERKYARVRAIRYASLATHRYICGGVPDHGRALR